MELKVKMFDFRAENYKMLVRIANWGYPDQAASGSALFVHAFLAGN